ncbi:transcriptional repressor [compost metagenome]|uniref:TetR/AcrR family transcriptional regulator n=1 Tax=Polaromonas aquatica TaxID=332657 RepID=A0ABW1TTH7_9BURK
MPAEIKPARKVAANATAAPTRKGPSTGNKKLEQRQISMESLLEAALRLFVSQGYRSTNLEQISGAAQLTKGAVYFYFRSKEAVLIELLKRVQRTVVDEAVLRVNAAGPGFTDKLVAYIHYQAGLGITHRDEVLLLILMSLEFKEREGDVQVFISELYERQRSFIETLVHSGQQAGEFRADLSTRELAAIILAINDGTFLEWFRRSATLEGPELVRALRAAVLGAATVPPAASLQA